MTSARAYLLSRLILKRYEEGTKKNYLYLAANGRDAVRFQKELEFFLGPFAKEESFFFPPYDVLPFSHLSPHNDIVCDRLKTLAALQRKTAPAFIATTGTALLKYLPPKDELEPVRIQSGDEKERALFLNRLTEIGYQNVPLVIDRGNFSVRGGLVDLFGPGDAYPMRMEWIGDEIESIRRFSPKTQRSFTQGENSLSPRTPHRQNDLEINLLPAREIILDDDTISLFSQKARQLGEDKDLPKSIWAPLIEKVKERIPFSGVETYLPLFYEKPTSFWDWLPPETVLIIDDLSELRMVIEDHFEEVRPLAKEALLTPEEAEISGNQFFEKSGLFPRLEEFPEMLQAETHEEIRREIERAKKGVEPLAPFAARLKNWMTTDRVFIVASSKPQAQRLVDLLSHYFPIPPEISQKSFAEDSSEPGSLKILIGDLSKGFRLPSERITIVAEEEIFGQKTRKRGLESGGEADFSSFGQLKIGDPIVHKDHGIGLYQGLIHMTIDGTANDFLLIEYRDGDKLYLPAYRMNLVQRYTGSEGKPRIDKLGAATWAKLKGKAEKVIRELAGELLNLYAARSAGIGFAFSPPNELFETFEASFPYEETPDQDQAIADVLADMEKARPMDRLVLGDVGYGKTEVALRAAFKAVLDGKQVALLVPTTLLAFQHYDRFTERFRDYPVKVEMISRFRSPAEQKKTLKEAAEGKVDILIGTHRLLQPDISFKNLGLLVIDEEHRFGVEHKEKLKRLRKNVDVLALTATPIPRTLYMSLVGVRAISVIETPPTDRLAIRTFVTPFESEVIREAISREIKRGGQVFVVHNEIESIGKMKQFLHELVPEAKIEFAHGQLEENRLEEIMIRFFHQEFNVLISTTIIESGIDIPTANTILINKAENFGLAQIYQLRGRVGRGNHRAYAYLLVTPDKGLTPEAKQRLAVLQRFSELGSGYKMASYDLEIRGAGNLLGSQQSGHMAAIGYELYTELLEGAVKELKGETVLDDIDPELHFRIPAYLPEDYIPDPPVRLEMYRRLASLDNEAEVDPAAEEMRDRFGSLPSEVENLLELSAIKALAKKLRIKQIRYDGKRFLYAFDPSSPLSPDLLVQRIKKEPKRYKLTPDFRFTVEKPLPHDLALAEAKKFLRELVLHV